MGSMSPSHARPWRADVIPALCVLALGAGMILARPALPIDETRYLQVFAESLRSSPLLLTLSGEPYAEKPPLLFWLARALTWLALPPAVALRLVPVLATALCAWFAARVGRRAGLELVGWLQVALWLPMLAGQLLLFDPLLACAVWAALLAWIERRERALVAWSAAALLAKGPVALLFLVPFLWALTPLRTDRVGDARRATLLATLALLAALVPLAAWALLAAARGGPEFAQALLWERWAGRMAGAADHARPAGFYLPVVLLGALPVTPLFLRRCPFGSRARGDGDAPDWCRRLAYALLFLALAFALVRGKQAHYLVPAAPALALLAAVSLARAPRAAGRLRVGVALQLGLLGGILLAATLWLPRVARSFGPDGEALLAGGGWRVPLGLAATCALGGLGLLAWTRASGKHLLALGVLSGGASLLCLHHLAGARLHPHALAAALAETDVPLAFLGSSQHGLYALLAGGRELEKLANEHELCAWSARHPAGLLVVDAHQLRTGVPEELEIVARDRVHATPVLVLRARSPASQRGSESARARPEPRPAPSPAPSPESRP